ncbi:MAG: hypothetical protein K5675_01755 [Lachnospiraceae bacterium]|nr:hypothetical protein [Lachnospiraceae bacterium]
MASYSITSSVFLRDFYSKNRQLAVKANRENATEKELSTADSLAMKKAIRALEDFDYGDGSDDDTDAENIKFYKTLKAFADTYNYTLDSSSSSSSSSIKSLSKKMKNFAEKYEEELGELGITFSEKGYMSVSASAIDNISEYTYGQRFSSTSTSKSDFLSDLSDVTKKIYRRIDTYL